MADPDLEIHIDARGKTMIFELVGSLISSGDIKGIVSEMRDSAAKNAVVVMDEVSYINSSGFSSLIVLADDLNVLEKNLYIVGLRKKVQVVFDSLGASELLKIFPTLTGALNAIRA